MQEVPLAAEARRSTGSGESRRLRAAGKVPAVLYGDEVVAAEVPLHLIGEAQEVSRADGVIEQQLFSLTVNTTPGNIPAHLDVDLSGLVVGDTVRVGDLELPSGVTTEVDADEPVVLAKASALTAEVEAEEAEAAEAVAEGAEAPSEAGEDQAGSSEA